MKSDRHRRTGFAIPDPDRAGVRQPVPAQVELVKRGGIVAIKFGLAFADSGEKQRFSPELRDCLDPFLRLAGASDQQVLEYARTWGSLGLCRPHLRLLYHGGAQCELLLVEPVEVWRFCARQLGALLRVAAQLRGGDTPTQEDWDLLQLWPDRLGPEELEALAGPEPPRPWPVPRASRGTFLTMPWTGDFLLRVELGREPEPRERHRALDPKRQALATSLNWTRVAKLANAWLHESGLRPTLKAIGGIDSPLWLGYEFGGLSSVLAIQVADALAYHDLYLCDLCQAPFSTRQRRRPSERDPSHYCPNCSRDGYRAVKAARARERYWADHTPKRRSPTHPEGQPSS